MASGSFTSSKSYEGRKFKFSWSSSYVSPGVTKVSWKLTATGGSSSYYYSSYSLKINGSSVGSQGWSKTYTGTKESGSFYVYHNTSGAGSFSVSLTAAVYYKSSGTTSKTYGVDTNYPYTSCSINYCNATLSNVNENEKGYLNDRVLAGKAKVTLNFGGSAGVSNPIARYDISYSINGGSKINIHSSSSTSCVWTIPSELNAGDVIRWYAQAIGSKSGYNSGVLQANLTAIVNTPPTNSTIETIGVVPQTGGNLEITFIGGSSQDSNQTLYHYYKLEHESESEWKLTTENKVIIAISSSAQPENFIWKNYDGLEYSSEGTQEVGRNLPPQISTDSKCSVFTVATDSTYLAQYNYINTFDYINTSIVDSGLWIDNKFWVEIINNDTSQVLYTSEKTDNTSKIVSFVNNYLPNIPDLVLFTIIVKAYNGYDQCYTEVRCGANNSNIFCKPKLPTSNLVLSSVYPCNSTGIKIETEDTTYENYFYDYIHFTSQLTTSISGGYKQIKLVPTVWMENALIYQDLTQEPTTESKTCETTISLKNHVNSGKKVTVGLTLQDSLGTLIDEDYKQIYSIPLTKVSDLSNWEGIVSYKWETVTDSKILKPYTYVTSQSPNDILTTLSLVVIDGAGAATTTVPGHISNLSWQLDLYLGKTLFAELMTNGQIYDYSGRDFRTGVNGITATVVQGAVQLRIDKSVLYNELTNLDKLKVFKDYPGQSDKGYVDYNALLDEIYLVARVVDTFGNKIEEKRLLTFDYREIPHFNANTFNGEVKDSNEDTTAWLIDTETLGASSSRETIESRMINLGDSLKFKIPTFVDPNGWQQGGFTVVLERAIYEKYDSKTIDINSEKLNVLPNHSTLLNKYTELQTLYIDKETYEAQTSSSTYIEVFDVNINDIDDKYVAYYRMRIRDNSANNLVSDYIYFGCGILKTTKTLPLISFTKTDINASYTRFDFSTKMENYFGTTILNNNIKYSCYNRLINYNAIRDKSNFTPKIEVYYRGVNSDYSEYDKFSISSSVYDIERNTNFSTLATYTGNATNSQELQESITIFKVRLILPVNSVATDNIIIETSGASIYKLTPTVSYRSNAIGINNKLIDQNDILNISQSDSRNFIKINGIDTSGSTVIPHTIELNVSTGVISGVIINSDSWNTGGNHQNIIQIRRGSNLPSLNDLNNYELGWNTTNKQLYINDGGNIQIVSADLSGLNYDSGDPSSTPYEYISRVQQTQGLLSATKTNFPEASTSQKGIVNISAQSFSGAKTFTATSETTTAVVIDKEKDLDLLEGADTEISLNGVNYDEETGKFITITTGKYAKDVDFANTLYALGWINEQKEWQ